MFCGEGVNRMITNKLNKIKKMFIFFVLFTIFFLMLLMFFKVPQNVHLQMSINNKIEDTYQVYFLSENNEELSEDRSDKKRFTKPEEYEVLKFDLNQSVERVRLDLGTAPATMKINSLDIASYFNSYNLDSNDFISLENSNQIGKYEVQKDGVFIQTVGTDPYVFVTIPTSIKEKVLQDNTILKYIICIIVSLVLSSIVYLFLKSRRDIKEFIKEIIGNRSLIYQLSINDFKTRFAGSYFGVLWAFVQPVITVLIYWFVFEVGFRSGPVQEVPFVLWLVAGIVPWFFFAESLGNSTNALIEYSYLVKKVVFQIRILPLVKIISAFYVHVFFILFIILMFSLYGYYPNLGYLQLIYYTFCAFCLVFSLSLITSSLIAFFRDLGQIIGLILQFGMWLTPILWHYSMLPIAYQWVLKINPAYYIVEGYRDTLVGNVWFWERYNQSVYFWVLTGILFLAGISIMKKLKPHFADVL